jgi:peptidoglycan DL-endopeptidase CwlO
VTSRTLVLVARARRSAEALVTALLVATLAVSAPAAVAAAASRPRDAAGDAQRRVEAAQRAANASANRYMAALSDFERLRTQATDTETAIGVAEQRSATLRTIVQERAARAYKAAGSNVPSILRVDNLPDAMRSDKLMATANVRDAEAMDLLRQQQEDLHVKREALRQLESRQTSALGQLQRASRLAESQLSAALRNRQDVQARLAAQAAAAAATARAAKAVHTPKLTASTRRAPSTAAAPSAPAPPPPSGGMSPHHNDPFLSCVRNRESRGNYGVVNPAGPWYGAYQFLASTWNVTARHAGRLDLVGVLPSSASAYDQDEMAWALYQWQGSGPWGGSC